MTAALDRSPTDFKCSAVAPLNITLDSSFLVILAFLVCITLSNPSNLRTNLSIS